MVWEVRKESIVRLKSSFERNIFTANVSVEKRLCRITKIEIISLALPKYITNTFLDFIGTGGHSISKQGLLNVFERKEENGTTRTKEWI